jgi:hypothetical protein
VVHCASGCKREMCVQDPPSDVSYGRSVYNDLSVSSGRSDSDQCQDLGHAGRLVPVIWKKRHGTDYPFQLASCRTPRSRT